MLHIGQVLALITRKSYIPLTKVGFLISRVGLTVPLDQPQLSSYPSPLLNRDPRNLQTTID